jgi:hypothetical protein
MITIANVNNQLEINRDGVYEYYSYSDIKSVSSYYSPTVKFSTTSGESYVVINFINENRNSSLKLPLSLLTDYASVEGAVNDINSWMNAANSSLLTSVGAINKRAEIVRLINDSGLYTSGDICSLSIANVGTGTGTVNGVDLKVGETVNFDAGAINNVFVNTFDLDATGTEFLIIYVH